MAIDFDTAANVLEEVFAFAEADVLQDNAPAVSPQVNEACEIVFNSQTQAYREVALGCTLVRIQDKTINIRQPYVNQGATAFNGRTLDERVVNPFLQTKRIPSTKGPYLSVFRRSVQFDSSIREGQRDKAGYDAFLSLVGHLESSDSDTDLTNFLRFLLVKFVQLREESTIEVLSLQRISLEQYGSLLAGLLATPSGGRFPVLLVAATLSTLKEYFSLSWEISWQGINVADSASGVGGDITVREGSQIIFAAEVTERPVDQNRVASTFTSKISTLGIEDYLFFVNLAKLSPEAKAQARQYFAQGHEVNFLEIQDWILMVLATVGQRGRALFNRLLRELVGNPDFPTVLKVSWNDLIAKIASGER